MRHRIYGKHLGRDKNQRSALFQGLVRALILHESITTTESKAKAIRGLIDRLVVRGKSNTNASKNKIKSVLPQQEISKKLMEEIAPRYPDRVSGFTEMVKLGRRAGDGAMMVKMSLVGKDREGLRVRSQESSEETKGIEKKLPKKEKVVKKEGEDVNK